MAVYWNPSAVFDAVRASVPTALAGRARLDACASIAATLPPAIVSYYLECRLEDDDDQVDFLTMVQHRAAAACFEQSLGASARLPAWQRTLQMFRASSSNDVIVGSPFFWLEFDVDARFQQCAPLASPGFCLEPLYLSRGERAPVIDQAHAERLGRAGLGLLQGDGTGFMRLQQCLASLPPGGSLIHVSVMLAREPSVMKLYVAVPCSDVLDYLQRIEWPGSMSVLAEVLGRHYHPDGDTAFLDLTVAERVTSRLGLALSRFNTRVNLAVETEWAAHAAGVSPAKLNALRSWWGVMEAGIDGLRTWLHRWVDIKLVVEEDGRLRHKAYLGFMPSLPSPFA